jgi:hypothetical protein
MRILGKYEQASEQKINIQKTSMFFSRNTSLKRRQEILQLSGLTEKHTALMPTWVCLPSRENNETKLLVILRNKCCTD